MCELEPLPCAALDRPASALMQRNNISSMFGEDQAAEEQAEHARELVGKRLGSGTSVPETSEQCLGI